MNIYRNILKVIISICSVLIAILLSFYLITFSRYPDLLISKNIDFLKFSSYFNVLNEDTIFTTLYVGEKKLQEEDYLLIEKDTNKYTHFIVIDRTLSTENEEPINPHLKKTVENKFLSSSLMYTFKNVLPEYYFKTNKGIFVMNFLHEVYNSPNCDSIVCSFYDGKNNGNDTLVFVTTNRNNFWADLKKCPLYQQEENQRTNFKEIFKQIDLELNSLSILNENIVVTLFSNYEHEFEPLYIELYNKYFSKWNKVQFNLICLNNDSTKRKEQNKNILIPTKKYLEGNIRYVHINSNKYNCKDAVEFIEKKIKEVFEFDFNETTIPINLHKWKKENDFLLFSYPISNANNLYEANSFIKIDKKIKQFSYKFIVFPDIDVKSDYYWNEEKKYHDRNKKNDTQRFILKESTIVNDSVNGVEYIKFSFPCRELDDGKLRHSIYLKTRAVTENDTIYDTFYCKFSEDIIPYKLKQNIKNILYFLSILFIVFTFSFFLSMNVYSPHRADIRMQIFSLIILIFLVIYFRVNIIQYFYV